MLLWNRCFVVENFWVLAYVQYRDFWKKENEKKRRFCAQLGGFLLGGRVYALFLLPFWTSKLPTLSFHQKPKSSGEHSLLVVGLRVQTLLRLGIRLLSQIGNKGISFVRVFCSLSSVDLLGIISQLLCFRAWQDAPCYDMKKIQVTKS